MDAGRYVREVVIPRHRCELPPRALPGDVWKCRCGKRFTCVDDCTVRGNLVTLQADWRRRFWPWPR